MIKTFKENDEVLYPNEEFVSLSKQDFLILKKLADQNKRKRIRLCAHKNSNDELHEMFIVHSKECYVRPHFHVGKSESLYVIEGSADLIIFNNNKKNKKKVVLSDSLKDGLLFHRQEPGTIHMIIIKTEHFIFHEVTQGPFKRADTIFPLWAPAGNIITDNSFIQKLFLEANIINEKI